MQPISANFIPKALMGCFSEAPYTAEHHMFRSGTMTGKLSESEFCCERQM
jgi:hypothetical protein